MRNARNFTSIRWLVCGLLALAVAVVYASQVVTLFYGSGATSYDAGWFAYVLSRFDFPPDNPLYLQQRDIPSFFAFHFAPLMPMWGAVSQLFHLSPPLAFAAYQGFFHALLFLAGTMLLPVSGRGARELALRILAGAALAFSPIALSAISYLHHELAMPILFISACLAWSRGRPVLAGVAFALSLAVRTDAGFHAAMFLFAFAAADWLQHKRLSRTITVAGVVAFLYSVAAFAIVHFEFPQFNNFRFSYSGNRFDHLSISFVMRRLAVLLDKRPELYVIFLTTLAIGALRRCLPTLFGALAILPWVGLHMIALRDIPGELYTYYAFPFLILGAWPLLVPLLRGSENGSAPVVDPRGQLFWFVGCAAALIVYLSSPYSDAAQRSARRVALSAFIPSVSVDTIRSVDRFAANLGRLEQQRSGLVFVDEAVVSLVPQTGRDYIFKPHANAVPEGNTPFLVVYFVHYEHAPDLERMYLMGAASDCYVLSGTPVRILARGVPASTIIGLEPHVAAIDCSRPR